MRRLARLALALAPLAAAPARADVLFLNSGAELTGTIVAIDSAAVRLREAGGAERSYARADVLKLKLVKAYGLPGEDSPARVRDDAVRALLARPPSPEEYPDDGVLRALDSSICRLDRAGAARCEEREVDYVLRERGKDYAANARFRSLPGVKPARLIWARSVSPARLSDLDDTSVQEGSEYPDDPAYDRMRSVKFAVPDVATGSIVDYRYDVDYLVALDTYPFFGRDEFRGSEPAARVRLELDAPDGVALSTASRGLPGSAFHRERRPGGAALVWEARDVPSFKREPQMPPLSRVAPTVTYARADTWQGVAEKAYAALEPRLAADPAVAAQAKRIAADEADPVEALYDWVAKEIKYENVLMGDAGFVPRSAAETLRAKAGNALDKPFLLFALLRAAGYDPSLVYSEARTEAAFEPGVPSIRQFSVALVRLERGGRTLFMSPIEDSRRYDELGGWLQGVHGLIVAGPGRGTLVVSPLHDASAESASAAMTLSLSAEGTLRGRVEDRARGGYQAGWRDLKDLARDDVRRRFEADVHGIHPQARLLSYTAENLDDLEKDVKIGFAFEAPGYALTASGGFLALRLPEARHPAYDLGAPSRETPMFWWEKDLSERRWRLTLPAGYSLYSAPGAADYAAPGGTFSARYAYDPASNTLTARESLRRDVVELSPSDYPAYKAFLEKVARFGEQWIVLRKAPLAVGAR